MRERIYSKIENEDLEEKFSFGITYRAICDLKDRESGIIFANFFKSLEFLNTFGWLKNHLSFDNKSFFTSDHRSALASYIFEQFAYRLVEKRLREIPSGRKLEYGKVKKVLSPHETFMLLKAAFSENRIYESHMGLGLTLEGFRNPDGLLLGRRGRETIICGVCEYTLQPIINPSGMGSKRRQLRALESFDVVNKIFKEPNRQIDSGRYLHSSYPNFPRKLTRNLDDLLFIYVRPRTENPKDRYLARIDGDSLHLTASFGSEQFYLVVDSLIEDTQALMAEKPISGN